MQKILRRTTALTALAALCWAASGASAAMIYPGPFVGTNVTFTNVTESSADPINDPGPLYGAPTLLPSDVLEFDPEAGAFSADAPPADSTDGALSFLVSSNTAAPITALSIVEGGDYQFLGSSPDGELVSATLFVRVLDPSDDSVIVTDSAVFVEAFDQPVVEGGFWNHSLSLDLSSYGLTEYKVIINNLLQASGDSATTSFIRKKEFQVQVVPEPASAALALTGLVLMAGRRRR